MLADLAIESEAATATALRLARAYDEGDTALRRFATAVLKYWVCKRATPHAAEALECLGGNGYVEESPMPRLLRDAPLNVDLGGLGQRHARSTCCARWRASPRACRRSWPSASWRAAPTRGSTRTSTRSPRLAALAGDDAQWLARRAVEDLALAFQASLLVRHAPAGGRRRVLRRPARRGARPRVRHAPARRRRPRSSSAR